jgi:hypothetical protein
MGHFRVNTAEAHRNSMAYVTGKLKALSEKSLSSRMETQVVATKRNEL